MSSGSVFFDSTVLLYALLDFQDTPKHEIAVNLVSNASGAISTQVINEVCSNIIRLTSAPEETIEKLIRDLFSSYLIILPSESTFVKASQLRRRYSVSFWDSMIIGSALEAAVDILYSEDMQHNLLIEDTLTIINPFINK